MRNIGDEYDTGISLKALQAIADEIEDPYQKEELEHMMEKADLDQDGYVNYDEFCAVIAKNFEQ